MKIINCIKTSMILIIILVIPSTIDMEKDRETILDSKKADIVSSGGKAGYILLEQIVEERKYFIPVVEEEVGDVWKEGLAALDGVSDPLWDEMWGWRAIGVEEAWKSGIGEDVVVAIIDTGCDLDHPDLFRSLWINESEYTGISGIDDDGNGYVDDLHGYDFVSASAQATAEGEDGYPPDGDPQDTNGHGTHVAGIIGAVAYNGLGISGVAPNCRLMVLRAAYTDSGGAGTLSELDVAEAIRYAVTMGANVINMSFGGQYSEIIHAEIRKAEAAGILLIASAGNNGSGAEVFPASCFETISVGAADITGNPAIFSSCIPGVDCLAPGVSVISTEPGGYSLRSGTSSAAPFVSGTAALILSGRLEIPLESVRGTILSGCSIIDPVGDRLYGCGGCGFVRADQSMIMDMDYFTIPEDSEFFTAETSDGGVYPASRRFILTLKMSNLLGPIEGGMVRVVPEDERMFEVTPAGGAPFDVGVEMNFELRYEMISLVPLDEGEMLRFRLYIDCGEQIKTIGIDQQVPYAPLYSCGAVSLVELSGDGDGAADRDERIEIEIEICGPINGGELLASLDVTGVSSEAGGYLSSEAILNDEGRSLLRFEFDIGDDITATPSQSGSVLAFLPLSLTGEGGCNTTEVPLWISYQGDIFTSEDPVCYQGGVAHTGTFSEGPGSDLKMKWHYDMPGTGSIVCQPVVSEEGVYAARREGEKCVVYAVERSSGELSWRSSLPGECEVAPGSMLWSGGVLFVPSGGYLNAVDCETGAIVWSRTMGDEGSGYTAGEPVGDKDIVFSTFHSPKIGEPDIVAAMDRLTGRQLWADMDDAMVYGTAPPAIDGTRLVLADLTGKMAAFDIGSGIRFWTRETGISPGFPLMIFSGAAIICGGGGKVGAFLLEDGEVEWECETGAIIQGPPCVNSDGILSAVVRAGFDAALLRIGPEGEMAGVPIGIEGYGFSGTVSAGPFVFAGRESGRMGVYSAAGETLAQLPVVSVVEAAVKLPFISGDELFVCVNTNNQDILISFSPSGDHAPPFGGRIANYPNPFNPSTTIRIFTSSGGHVRLRIFDAAGRLVRTIIDGFLPAGSGEYVWNGSTERGGTASSGLFFARLECPDGTFSRKILLLK